jgi:hypothetical protein
MSNTSETRSKRAVDKDEMLPEYHLDYSRSLPNRFAGKRDPNSVVVLLDPDVSSVFRDAEAVNKALRALLTAMPASRAARKRT